VKKLGYSVLILVGLGFTRFGHSAPLFSVAGTVGFNFANPTVSTGTGTNSTTTNATFGGGIIADLSFYEDFQIEAGALYLPYSYSNSIITGTTSTQYTYKFFHFPVLVRWSPLPILSIGAGGYLGFGTGTIDSQVNLGNGTSTTPLSSSYSTANFNSTDFGLVFSVAGDLPIGPLVSLFVDARYQLGLVDLNNDLTATFKMNAFMVLVGARLNF
jgi:hypothetical protein